MWGGGDRFGARSIGSAAAGGAEAHGHPVEPCVYVPQNELGVCTQQEGFAWGSMIQLWLVFWGLSTGQLQMSKQLHLPSGEPGAGGPGHGDLS